MTSHEAFLLIDEGITKFMTNKNMSLSKDPKSDWLVFEWRQLTWRHKELELIIEICPQFDEQENISSWTLYSAVFYDKGEKRYYTKTFVAEEKQISFIAQNISELLTKAYRNNMNTTIEGIPISN